LTPVSKDGGMEEDKRQISIMQYVESACERVVIKVKLSGLLIFLYTIVIFVGGYYIGQREKTSDMFWFADKVRDKTIQTTPGAQFALSGITYCFDQGNIFQAERQGNWMFKKKKANPDRPAIGGDK
jgi:hypothetical protein